ncbi:MAG: PD-(D/E)XK nuclease family protein [Pirellulales bacterium]|nr:PD-(D/E)XK nuclease family protein [Pirellulales bacterium]
MTAKLTVITGPAHCGKTDRLLAHYRHALSQHEPGAALWLAPTWRAAAEVRRRLLGGVCDGCFSPGVMTFEAFADTVLEVAPVAVRPMSRLMKRQLVRRLINEQIAADRLHHFGPIARTSGLVDLLCDFVGEMKRLEVWPEQFHRACNARGIAQKDLELLEIYDQYQRCLRERQLYDAEGRFWSARDLLEKALSSEALLREGASRESSPAADGAVRRPWERLRLVVADGFTDFTRTQHEILEILAGHVQQMWISLPLEVEPRRTALFAKSLGTLGELRRRHAQPIHQELPRSDHPRWPAMAHLERALFGSPRHRQPAVDMAGVEILAAARQWGEIQCIGSRIKRLLVEGQARADEIAIVFRSPGEIGPLIDEVFGALGIPVALEQSPSLDRSPVLKALVRLLRLDVEDWPFRDLLAVLASNYFRPDWQQWKDGATLIAAERTVRRLQVPRGRERLLHQLRSTEGKQEADSAIVLAVFEHLAAAMDELPRRATPTDWAKAWQRLAERTGLLRAIEQPDRSGSTCRGDTAAADWNAWWRLQRLLREGDTLARWLDRHPPEWDRREALAALADTLASERMPPEGDESGHVRVLSAQSVRALRIPHLFLAGLSEKAFPPPDREDRLYSEAECQRLIEEGLPLVARTERNREEMLLFYEVVTRATKRLYLSYPALDGSAQPLAPSPYLLEVEQACGPGRIRRIEVADLSPIPADDEPLSAAAFRVKAVATAIGGNLSLLAGFLRDPQQEPLSRQVMAGLDLTQRRRDRDRFGPAEGVLTGGSAPQGLAAAFPWERTYSATELEQYASCPYRFFLERVLRLEPIEELALAVDHKRRGWLMHDLLAMLHRRVNQALGRPGSPVELDPSEYERLLQETLEQATGQDAAQGILAAMHEIDRRLLVRWIADYRRQHERYDGLFQSCDAPPAPALFEVSFGRKEDDRENPSGGRALEMHAGGRTIRISGRVDRIDLGRVAEKTVFNVIDYKTGASVRFSPEAVAAGTALQLPLYAIAVSEILLDDRDSVPWQAGYWYVRNDGFKPRQALKMYRRGEAGLEPEAGWEQIRSSLDETVVSLVESIRRGEFPVHSSDEHCTGYCPYHTVCRINQVRSLEKTWRPATKRD